jgi:zinc transporter ZupT
VSNAPDQTYLARTFDDGRYDWARRREVRRRAVLGEAALVATLIAATLAAATTDSGWPTWFFVAWTAGMLAFIPLHSVLNLGIRGVLDRDKRSLDEHQRRLAERSHSAMSWPSYALTFAAWAGAVTVLAFSEHVAPALCLGFLLWFTSGLLTYWHLAWTSPEEPADTE